MPDLTWDELVWPKLHMALYHQLIIEISVVFSQLCKPLVYPSPQRLELFLGSDSRIVLVGPRHLTHFSVPENVISVSVLMQ